MEGVATKRQKKRWALGGHFIQMVSLFACTVVKKSPENYIFWYFELHLPVKEFFGYKQSSKHDRQLTINPRSSFGVVGMGWDSECCRCMVKTRRPMDRGLLTGRKGVKAAY